MTNSARQAKQQKGSIVAETQISNRLLTAPNFLCVIRLLGSVVLVPVAWQGYQQVFLWLFLFLAMTDWADGKLANMLNQRSVFGARLDSWADTTLYAALLAGIAILYGETLRAEIAWVLPPVGCFLLSVAAGFWKFGRWPSYHTRTAKITWLLAMLGTIALFTDWSLWPLRIAFAAGTLSNLEALLITIISPTWRVDVRSIYHVWKNR